MKIKITIITFFLLTFYFTVSAQNSLTNDSLKGFDEKDFAEHLINFKGNALQRESYVKSVKRNYIDKKFNLGRYKPSAIAKNNGNQPGVQATCDNIDFEQGTTTGWTVVGRSQIMSGAGMDPYGNFPVVYPGGNYSLRLSDDNVGTTTNYTSTATRVITVTPGNTFFKLHFAIDILDYPHDSSSAAKFSINFFNSAGALLPCPQFDCYYYEDAFGPHQVGISNFQQTWGSTAFPTSGPGVNLGGQQYPVTYAGWQTVGMDLTSYVGSNITCVVTCAWCLYQYDWAYCYLDADCPTTVVPTTGSCLSLPANLCGPPGMDTYAWTAPPGNSVPTSSATCISATTAGVYTLNCSVTTCSTTAYTYTYNVGPGPTASYTNTTASCAGSVNFTSTSITGGGAPISSYTWNWGDGTPDGSGSNPTHNFSGVGTQTVILVVNNGTCVDSVQSTVNIPPHPIVNFTAPSNCANAPSNFTSTSSSVAGIASQNWHFGDGSNGTGATPSHTYASAGTYTVTLIVTDNSPCTDSIKTAFTVNPLPTITTNSPSACNGASATLMANGASTYTWSPTTGIVGSATSGTVTTNPPATQTYVVTGTDVNGCVNTNTTTVLVVPNPVINVTNPSVCVGYSTNVIATGATAYTWSPAMGLSAVIGDTVIASPAVTTVYTITGSVGTCTATGTSTVTVNPSPTVTVNNSSICVTQQTATLTGVGASTYSWTPSTGLSSSFGTTVYGTPSVTTSYTVTGTDANGCYNKASSVITVFSLPVVIVQGDTVCVNTTVSLTAAGGVAYSWSGPGGYSSNLQNPTLSSATTNMSGAYAVTVTDINGCKNGNVAQVLVNPLPAIGVTANTPCVGSTLNLTSSAGVSWAWTGPFAFTSTVQNPSIPNAGSTVAGLYSVNATDANGCIGTGSTFVTINPLPVLAINPPLASGCAPLCVTLSNTTTATGICSWAFGDGSTSTTCSPNHCFTGQGTLTPTLTLTDANGCTNSANASILVYPVPVADFYATPQPTTILDNYIHFTDATTNAVVSAWYWTLGDPLNTTSTSSNPQITYLQPGSYPVHMVVTSNYGCKDSTDKTIVIAEDFEIYVPNAFSPNADGTNDTFFAKGEGIKEFKMRVFDRWGALVYYTEDILKGWDGRIMNKGDVVLEDIYVWKIELRTVQGDRRMLKGVVSLIK